MVVAPPGFGKTTLLVQWQAAEERPIAWLSVDDGDNDPAVFWAGVIASIDRVVPGFGGRVVPRPGRAGGPSGHAVVARILNELLALQQPVVLVLEDYHRITESGCHDGVALLLEHQPACLQVIISTRTDPRLPLARLRANGRLTELRAAELAFTVDEAEEVLTRTWGLELASELVAVLHARTEGWPAGMYLAYLSARGAADIDAFVTAFGGATRLVIDYLMEVVLDRQTEDLRSFLIETSILDGLSGSVCDAVTGRNDSASVLTQLERANLFVVAVDGGGHRFRYHQLFAQALGEALDRQPGDRRAELHRRAMAWFLGHEDISRAVRHAFAAGDLDVAATLIATHWIEAVNAGRPATVRGWLEAFPRAVVRADARLLLVTGWIAGWGGDAESGLRAISAAQGLGYQGELPDGSGTVGDGCSLLRGSFVWSDVTAMLAAARTAEARERERDSSWQALATLNLGRAQILYGQPEQAREVLLRAITVGLRAEQWITVADAHALLAQVSIAADDLDQAQPRVLHAIGMADRWGFADLPQVGFYYVISGSIKAARGEYEQADRLMTSGLAQLGRRGEILHVAYALLCLAPVRQALGALDEAGALIAEARMIIDGCPEPGVLRTRLVQTSEAVRAASRRTAGAGALTDRELKVLELLAGGSSEREAGATLFLSRNTIHSHTKAIYVKLGSSSREKAVTRARELGLIS